MNERGVGITDSYRIKKAAEWFYTNIFKDEAIRPRAERPAQKMPSLLRTARSLENNSGNNWQSRESIFLKQAKLLANYEDDYRFDGNVIRYFPTYQALTDQELRGYFTWRTQLRKGNVYKTSLSFAFLYIYELINQIGAADAMEGYRKLKDFESAYGALDGSIHPYLSRWINDYVVYYGLNPSLLAETPQVVFDRSISILDQMRHQPEEKVIYALKQLSPKWLDRSKFYAQYPNDCNRIIYRVLCRISDHYDTRCKKGFTEQYFGRRSEFQVRLFDSAVFCDPLKIRNTEFYLDDRCIYRCKNGLWTVTKHSCPLKPNGKLGDLLKTIDSMMRDACGYRHPVKPTLDTKWMLKIIQEEIQKLQDEQKAAEARKITIDHSVLARIRRDAAATRDKLMVEEELDFPEESIQEELPQTITASPSPADAIPSDIPLSPAEYRLLQCLLYQQDYSWVQREGHMLSVLADGINEKLYDTFFDSVLDDTPELIEDYIDDLKEMIAP